jgi:hypothetical protein
MVMVVLLNDAASPLTKISVFSEIKFLIVSHVLTMRALTI